MYGKQKRRRKTLWHLGFSKWGDFNVHVVPVVSWRQNFREKKDKTSMQLSNCSSIQKLMHLLQLELLSSYCTLLTWCACMYELLLLDYTYIISTAPPITAFSSHHWLLVHCYCRHLETAWIGIDVSYHALNLSTRCAHVGFSHSVAPKVIARPRATPAVYMVRYA